MATLRGRHPGRDETRVRSRRQGRGFRGLLFDQRTNQLVEHARFFPIHRGRPLARPRPLPQPSRPSFQQQPPFTDNPVQAALYRMAEDVLWHAEQAIRPRLEDLTDRGALWLREWVLDQSRTAKTWARSAWNEKFGPGHSDAETPSERQITAVSTSESQTSGRADTAAGTGSPTMSIREALQRFDDAVLAAAYAGDQLRRLQEATIVDDDGQERLARANLDPERVADAIYSALIFRPTALEAENLQSFEDRLLRERLRARRPSLEAETAAERPDDEAP